MLVMCKWEKKRRNDDVRLGVIIKDIADSTHEAGSVPVLRNARITPREIASRLWFANPVQRGLRRQPLTRTIRTRWFSVFHRGNSSLLKVLTATSESSTASHVRVYGQRPGKMWAPV